ncbi:MAG: peptidylprolyl isomerase [Rikenellaceae bacterium]
MISKIAILPASDINRKLDVKEELISLRDRILNGARFSAIARMYSDDVDSALQGGEMTPSPSTVYSQNFKEAVETLPIGQISQVVETEDGFHLIEVLEKQGEEYRVRHILRKIKFTPEERVEAIERLDSVANEIREGNLTFEAAVAKYSQDEESRVSKGLMTNNTYKYYGAKYKSTRFTKEELTTLYEHVAPLKKGEISNAFEYTDTELEESIIILKIDDIIPTHTANIDDDYSLIEELAIATKRNEVLEKWIDEKIDDIYIKIEDPYRDIFDSKSRWRK